MTYQKLDNLLGLTNLTDFANQLTIKGCQITAVMQPDGTLLLSVDDKWKYWGLNFDWTNPFGIWDKLDALVRNVQDIWRKLGDIWNSVWNAIGTGWKSWWDEIWEAIRRQYYNFSAAFFEFTRDPWGYLFRVIQNAVSPLISGIKTIGIDIWDFVSKVRNAVSEVVSSFVDSAKNTIVKWITDRVNSVYNWIESAKIWLNTQIYLAIKTIQFLPGEMFSTVKNFSTEAIDQIKAATSAVLKTIDFGLGGLADAFQKAIGGIFGNFWDWFKGSLMNFWGFVNKDFLIPLKIGSDIVMTWLWDWIQGQIREIINIAKQIIPRSPEEGASMIWEGLGFLGMGAGVLSLMTLGGGLAKRISGADIPGLAAIVADFSGFKYITGAIMGGLVTAAYAQPLKYYYNALFQPYLPSYGDVFKAFSRNIIGPERFKFFLKYQGVPEKYFYLYDALASDMVSPRLLSTIAEAEILEPEKMFYYVMDNGYDPAKSAYITTALLRRGISGLIRDCKSAIFKNYKEGFISLIQLQSELKKLDERKSMPVTFTGADGTTYGATIYVPLPSDTLETIRAEWEAFFDLKMDEVSTLKTSFSREAITLDEFTKELSGIIVVPEKAAEIISIEKAKKFGKEEPDKGKDLRKELKSILTRCYKEGYITYDKLKGEIDLANQSVDEKTLIIERANWEAFADDMSDWLEIYTDSLSTGLITEAEFRRDLVDMGFRSSKVELLIRADFAKKTGRAKEKKEIEAEKLKEEMTAELVRIVRRKADLSVDKFVKGIINEDALRTQLRVLGLSDDEVFLTVEEAITKKYKAPEEEAEREKRLAAQRLFRQKISTATTKFRKDLISEGEFRSLLLAAGLPTEEVDLIIEEELALKYKPS